MPDAFCLVPDENRLARDLRLPLDVTVVHQHLPAAWVAEGCGLSGDEWASYEIEWFGTSLGRWGADGVDAAIQAARRATEHWGVEEVAFVTFKKDLDGTTFYDGSAVLVPALVAVRRRGAGAYLEWRQVHGGAEELSVKGLTSSDKDHALRAAWGGRKLLRAALRTERRGRPPKRTNSALSDAERNKRAREIRKRKQEGYTWQVAGDPFHLSGKQARQWVDWLEEDERRGAA